MAAFLLKVDHSHLYHACKSKVVQTSAQYSMFYFGTLETLLHFAFAPANTTSEVARLCVVGSDWSQQHSSTWFHMQQLSLPLLLFFFHLLKHFCWLQSQINTAAGVHFRTLTLTEKLYFLTVSWLPVWTWTQEEDCWRCSFPVLPLVLKPQPPRSV